MTYLLQSGSRLLPNWAAIGALGQWFAGVMTLAAVWVALFAQRRQARRDRPSLSIAFEIENAESLRYVSPEFAAAGEQPRRDNPSNREELWLRLVVHNKSSTAARDVQVRMLGVFREGDAEPENRSNLWFKAANLNSHSVDLLPQHIPFHFDMGFVRHLVSSNELSFHLMLVRPPLEEWAVEQAKVEADARNRLSSGWTYTVHVAVLSSNADAVEYQFSLRLKPQIDGAAVPGRLLGRASLAGLLSVESLREPRSLPAKL